jgi:hypothetical protein
VSRNGLIAIFSTLFGSVLFSTAVISSPLQPGVDLLGHASAVEKVWCHRGYCDGDGVGVGGLIGGLVGGVIAAGTASAAAQQEAQAAAQQQAAACAQRYRSYDPTTGTYLSKGRRYPCP